MIYFTLPGNPVSSKNSRPIFINKATGSRFIGKSKLLKEYIDNGFLELHKQLKNSDFKDTIESVMDYQTGILHKIRHPFFPITEDIEITFTFYVQDKRKRDLVNLCQAPLDLLQKANIISDDSIVKSLDGSRIYYDKENPRTEIEIKII